jgi:4-hydroxy-3-polyprenylbenzoate decarboxylase
MSRVVLGISGASGAIYGRRTLEALLAAGREVHLIVSPAAAKTIRVELVLDLDPYDPDSVRAALAPQADPCQLKVHRPDAMEAPVSSGSFPTDGMAIVPCSMGTIGRIASGVSVGLLDRAADVCLKERRRLVLVPRETPYSAIHLENMLAVTRAGAVVLPASPGFYGHPQRIEELVDFVVARILDHLGVPNHLSVRYGVLPDEEEEPLTRPR